MDKIEAFLKEKEEDSLLRVLHPARLRKDGKIYFKDREYIDFCSNDYLGLSSHPALKIAAKEALEKWGTGSGASRLLSGDLDIHHELEEKIANFKDKEDALIFNSGYQANLGIISAFCEKKDAVFCDRLCHASILDGALLSGARFFRFLHNDTGHLEFLLKRERNKFKDALIITETIFSMDGDRAPLKELIDLKEKYDCFFMVDEAHATGVFGKKGSGIVEEDGSAARIDFIMGTFSKALGSFGGYIACSKKLKNYLINSSRSFIYSTSLPAPIIAANLASLDIVEKEPHRRIALLENACYFREKLEKRGFKSKTSSQIVPLILGEAETALGMGDRLKERGFWALPIRPPTVPKGEARLRFSLTYHHTKEIFDKLIEAI